MERGASTLTIAIGAFFVYAVMVTQALVFMRRVPVAPSGLRAYVVDERGIADPSRFFRP